MRVPHFRSFVISTPKASRFGNLFPDLSIENVVTVDLLFILGVPEDIDFFSHSGTSSFAKAMLGVNQDVVHMGSDCRADDMLKEPLTNRF